MNPKELAMTLDISYDILNRKMKKLNPAFFIQFSLTVIHYLIARFHIWVLLGIATDTAMGIARGTTRVLQM